MPALASTVGRLQDVPLELNAAIAIGTGAITGLLNREQWAGLGDRERSTARKERRRNSLLTPAASTESPDLRFCVLAVPPSPLDARLVGHTGQVAARVRRLGRGPAPSETLMSQLSGDLAKDLKV